MDLGRDSRQQQNSRDRRVAPKPGSGIQPNVDQVGATTLTVLYPLRLLMTKLGNRTLADVLTRLRCDRCGGKPAPVNLCAGHRRHVGGAPPDWAIELVPDQVARFDFRGERKASRRFQDPTLSCITGKCVCASAQPFFVRWIVRILFAWHNDPSGAGNCGSRSFPVRWRFTMRATTVPRSAST